MISKKRWMPWLIEGGIALAVFMALAVGRGAFTAGESAEVLRILCDAFFVPGIMLFSFGVLAFCAYGGVFDMVSYGFRSLLVMFTPFRKPENHMKYFEYKLMREKTRTRPRPVALIIGTVLLLLACVCLVMYNMETF